MTKKYQFIKTSTAGNRTGYIISQDAYQEKSKIMAQIFKKKNLEAEQYAFLWQAENQVFINMAGGELSGGATLASPVILGKFTGKSKITTMGKTFTAQISNKDINKSYVQVNWPINMLVAKKKRIKIKLDKSYDGYLVKLQGIAYFVCKEKISNKSKAQFRKLNQQAELCAFPSIGMIEIMAEGKMRPTVWVKKLNTITKEQGCTTGTISAEACFPTKNNWWQQPSGEFIKAKITSEQIILESSVEILADGQIYIDTDQDY